MQEWFTVLEHYHRLNATVSDLIMGNSYNFRVFAENKVGRSEKAAVTKEVANIQKTGEDPLAQASISWNFEFQHQELPRDMCLRDKSATEGHVPAGHQCYQGTCPGPVPIY